MARLKMITIEVEGDAAAISAACDLVRKELGLVGPASLPVSLVGQASLPVNDARASAPAPPLSLNGSAPKASKARIKGGAQRAPRPAGTPVPLNKEKEKGGASGTAAARILRYLAESHDNGDPDCTIDEVYRISGSGTRGSAAQCLVKLKRQGLAELGGGKGQWRISQQGLEAMAKQAVAKLAEDTEHS
jgi:hypothetical protein